MLSINNFLKASCVIYENIVVDDGRRKEQGLL
jgi:hypothetical protein